MNLVEQVSHEHGIDLAKITQEFDPKWAIEREQAFGNPFGPFHQKWLLDRAPEKVQKILSEMRAATALDLAHGREPAKAASQGFVSSDYNDFPPASFTAINTTTTETNLWNPAIWAPLPVGAIRGGKAWRCTFGGVAGTTGTPAISFRARCGTNNSAPPTGTDLGVGPTMTLGTFTAQPFHGEGIFGCRAIGIGASGATIVGTGFVIMAGAAAATTVATCVFGGLTTATTIDNSVAQGLSVSVIWGTSSASNTLTPQWMMFHSMN